MDFLTPDGSLTRVFFPSSECPITIAEVPEALARVPRSPILASTFEMMVPSGICFTGRTLPTVREAAIIIFKLNRKREKKTDRHTFVTSINKLAGVHALNCDEKLSVLLEFVLVSKNNLCERCATTWIVHNILHNSLDVSVNHQQS